MIFMIGFLWGQDIPLLRHARLVPALRNCFNITIGLLPERFRAIAEAAGDVHPHKKEGKGKP
jgi:hypothetical protein